MFLGVNARTTNWNADNTEFRFVWSFPPPCIILTRSASLVVDDNPLADYVELPEHLVRTLWYSNMLCGVIRGAFEMVPTPHCATAALTLAQVQYRVETRFVKDTVRGDDATEIRVVLKEVLKDEAPFGDED
jgi:hypothetical protein